MLDALDQLMRRKAECDGNERLALLVQTLCALGLRVSELLCNLL